LSPAEWDDGALAVGGLDRAAAILGAFDAAHRELTLAALVARSGLPRSTAHRTADRMIKLGWLDKPKGRYRIGNRLFEIASLAPIRLQLREAVLPFLQDLHSATRVTVQLGVLDGAQILVVEKITGHRPMPMLSQVAGSL
jgi:DNA-binding IclR family transcriptional regulator